MFKPKFIKQGELLVKGVQKFTRYKTDIMKPGKQEEIEGMLAEFKEALKGRDKEKCQEMSKTLTKLCETSVPSYKSSSLRENIEVIFVTIVFALGIRAYFLQPFKIPTGSMEPTLFGINAEQTGEGEDEPNILRKGWELVTEGRNYTEVRAPVDGTLVGYREKDLRLSMLTELEYQTDDGKIVHQNVWAPAKQLAEDLWFKHWPRSGREPLNPRQRVTKGELLARGFVKTGDQVLVNKFSYHFRRPKRGEVFVFNTGEIDFIKNLHGGKSTHYIKRLCAIPGDQWEINPPKLMINGQEAQESTIQRNWIDANDDYPGYTLHADSTQGGKMAEERYLALGDNSANSLDSRRWGGVPEQSIVGPALVVYWPFTSRWGLIR